MSEVRLSRPIRLGVVGLGKMGISHYSIANAYDHTEVSICDTSGYLLEAIAKYSGRPAYRDYDRMLAEADLDAVIIATPSQTHFSLAQKAMERGLHVFCEKPLCLNYSESKELASVANDKELVNQVGYHYRYVGAFQEMKRIVESGALGKITHVLAEAYGPVILRPKGKTWRTVRAEGGGCLYDYAAHPIDLLIWYFGAPDAVSGTILNSIFSSDTDDEVYSTLMWEKSGLSAHLSVNWSDESYRKMSTKITMTGTNGRLSADRQECQLYLREQTTSLPGYRKGWNVRYTTELTQAVGFYLRGEEYSAQIYDFISAIRDVNGASSSDFSSAAATDRTIEMILADKNSATSPSRSAPLVTAKRKRWLRR